MKKILLTLLAFLTVAMMNAEPVSRQQALKKARLFMPGKKFSESKASTRSDAAGASDAFYVFNAEGNGGYVIVSGDDRTTEILGYSKTGNLDMNQLPENLKWWLGGYARQIKALGSSLQPAKKAMTRSADSKAAIQPLIKTHWNQYAPYNLMCPDWKGRDWRDGGFATDNKGNYSAGNICVTGCVATAMAQIMYYYQYPKSCPEISEYNTRTYDWKMNALPATTFDWESMKTTYTGSETDASATAVATLFRYCGQAVGMDYDLGGSSSVVYPSVLIDVFGFSKNIRNIYRDLFTTSQWEDIIYAELVAGRPVFYSGQAKVGGHQFIVDGYDGEGLFHMNWGWGGMSDDYYVLSLADPDSQGIGGSASGKAFQFDQDALIGVQPPTEGEVLKPGMESCINEMATATYDRTNKDADFTEVQFDGIVYAHYNVPSTEALSVQIGWALCQNDQIKRVVSSFSQIFETGLVYRDVHTTGQATFGAGLELGKYQVCQVYRYSDDDAWTLCAPYYATSFFMAEVTATTLTIRQTQPSFTVNSITAPDYPSAGSPMDVTLHVTNDGETFEQVVVLWEQKEGESTWTEVATAIRKIDPGKSGDVVITYEPTAAGNYTLKVTKGDSEEALKTTTVTVYATIEKTINNIKYVCNTGSKTAIVVGHTYDTSSDSPVSVEIPATFTDNGIEYKVTEIADYAFIYCFPLASLTIPSSVESIGAAAFVNCYLLEEVTIPEGVKHIGDDAFRYCFYVKTIELPASLESIGDYAFGSIEELTELTSVVSNISEPFSISDNVFGIENGENITPPTATLSVPNGTKSKYEAAAGWKRFTSIVEMAKESPTVDVETIVNCILSGEYQQDADLNNDGKVNAADLVLLINTVQP